MTAIEQSPLELWSYTQAVEKYRRSSVARRLAVSTVAASIDWLERFGDYLQEVTGELLELYPVREITRAFITDWLGVLVGSISKSTGRPISSETVHKAFSVLRAWFNWLVEVDALLRSPMVKMKAPKITIKPITVVTPEQIKRVLSVCMNDGQLGRRDMAMILMLWDTGVRRAELATMKVKDLDLDNGSILVHGKGDKYRVVYFGQLVKDVLWVYLADRDCSEYWDLPELWLGFHDHAVVGALKHADAVGQMLLRRVRQSGLPDISPHQLRHSFAHHFLSVGGQESDLGVLLGWSTPVPAMLKRYAASVAGVRAEAAHKHFGPGDRLSFAYQKGGQR